MSMIFRSKARLAFAKLGKMCCIPEKLENRQKECMPQSLRLHALTSESQTIFGVYFGLGYVHGDEHIWLGSLKLWMPINL